MRLPADSDIDAVGPKLAHDLRYAESLSFALDLRIAISTGLHFVGWAAMASSRKLVQPFAPNRTPTPQVVVTLPNQPSLGRRTEDRRVRRVEDSKSLAA
jgi:hypothetical protein